MRKLFYLLFQLGMAIVAQSADTQPEPNGSGLGFKKKPKAGLSFGKTRTRIRLDYMLNYQKPSYVCVLFFGQYSGLSGIKELGPPKSFVLVVWWIGLGSLQLCWANYELSCAQNMDPTTHKYSYMHIYIYIYIYIAKQTAKEQ